MSNPLSDFNDFVRANLPSGVSYDSTLNRYVVNSKRFLTYQDAVRYRNYLNKFAQGLGGGVDVSLTDRDTEFDLSGVTTYGTYADGSPWVVPGAGFAITAATPTATTRTVTINGGLLTDVDVHGMMRDPGQAEVPSASLFALQTGNRRTWRAQGWDGQRNDDSPTSVAESTPYGAIHNVDPGFTGSSITSTTPATYVKAVSNVIGTEQQETIDSFGVLTVVASAPAANSCRPSCALPSKVSRWTTSDIVLPTASPQSYTGIGDFDYAYFAAELNVLWHMLETSGSKSRNITTGTQGGYWGTIAEKYGQAIAWLIYGEGTETQRRDIATKICQAAEDTRGRILQGGILIPNGGHCHAADVVIRAAAELLPGLFDDVLAMTIQIEPDDDINGRPQFDPVLAEMVRVEPVTQAIVDIDPLYISAPYPSKMIGWPEWSADFGTDKSYPDGIGGNEMEQLENLLVYDASVTLAGDDSDKPTYRHITMKAMVPLTLFLHEVGSSQIADNQIYFDYIDRHMGEIISQNGSYQGVGAADSNALKDWVIEAWSDRRKGNDIYAPGGAVVAVVGQSEPNIGYLGNKAANVRATQLEPVLAGVDCRVMLSARNNDNGTTPVAIVVNQANADLGLINAGMITLANSWHLASGGQRLCIVDVTRSGTSLPAMLTDSDTSRDFFEDLATVQAANTAFGSVTDVLYDWWNTEASVAKTLWESRSLAFYGVTTSGDPADIDGNAVDHVLIDSTDRGYGLFPPTAKFHTMMPGPNIRGALSTFDPPQPNYTTETAGSAIDGRIAQLSYPAHKERIDIHLDAPAANAGEALITRSLVRFGDYSGGVQETPTAESLIHPSILSKDGQPLFGSDTGIGIAIAKGYNTVPALDRVEWASDGSYADFVFSIADTATLTTQRIQDSETVASPRPHQQEVMGFVVYRDGDTDRTAHPVYRTDNTDATAYPTAYRGTVTIQDTGTGTGGAREGVVRVTPEEAFVNGDIVHFGTDGNYGEFCLHGSDDYDANMYRDGLRAHIAGLESGTHSYPGIPVRVQEIALASGITGPSTTFADSEQGQDFGDTSQWKRNSGAQPNIVSDWMIKLAVGYVRADSADGALSLAAPSASTDITACCDVRLSSGQTSGTLRIRLLNVDSSTDGDFGIVFPGATKPASTITDSGIISMGGDTYRVWAKMAAANVSNGDRIIMDVPSSDVASDRVFDLAQPAIFYADLTPTEIENLGPALAAP